MWNNGTYLLWSHICDLYHTDQVNGGKTVPKLSADHIKLNPYSRMTVSYAAQVLSETVSVNLKLFSDEAHGTADYCQFMDKFFDCLNTRSSKESVRKAKPNCAPYTSPDDPRLNWLVNNFLKYFDDWKDSVDNRPGEFSKTDRGKMFISKRTYDGLRMTVHSTVELVKYLLNNGFDFVLTERFCQDILEAHFGDHRKLGRRSQNPDIDMFGYQTQHLRVQKQVTTTSGNTRGRYDNNLTWENYSNEPCEKRKKKSS